MSPEKAEDRWDGFNTFKCDLFMVVWKADAKKIQSIITPVEFCKLLTDLKKINALFPLHNTCILTSIL